MTDFNELELNKEVSEMDGDEAKETLAEFMEAHQKNKTAYDETVSDFRDSLDEVQEDKEELEETIGELKNEYAEEAAEHVRMPAELLQKRFDFHEIRQIIDDAEEFAESQEETDEGEGKEPLTDFADKDQKGQTGGGDEGNRHEYREKAARALEQNGITLGE